MALPHSEGGWGNSLKKKAKFLFQTLRNDKEVLLVWFAVLFPNSLESFGHQACQSDRKSEQKHPVLEILCSSVWIRCHIFREGL